MKRWKKILMTVFFILVMVMLFLDRTGVVG